MIEATRRRSPALSGSAMRRLMTRPIHAHLAVAAQPRLVPAEAPADVAEEIPADAVAPVTADTAVDVPALSEPKADAADADLTRLLEFVPRLAELAAYARPIHLSERFDSPDLIRLLAHRSTAFGVVLRFALALKTPAVRNTIVQFLINSDLASHLAMLPLWPSRGP